MLIEIINKQLLLQLVGYLCYWQMGFNSVFKELTAVFFLNINILNRNTERVSFPSKLTRDGPRPKGILQFGELLTAREVGVSSVRRNCCNICTNIELNLSKNFHHCVIISNKKVTYLQISYYMIVFAPCT